MTELLAVNYIPKKAPKMFDWVLNTPLNTITIFFWRFQIKVNDFFKFFSTINFSYQYLPEAKTYLEPSRTSTIQRFHDFILQNSSENTCAGASF